MLTVFALLLLAVVTCGISCPAGQKNLNSKCVNCAAGRVSDGTDGTATCSDCEIGKFAASPLSEMALGVLFAMGGWRITVNLNIAYGKANTTDVSYRQKLLLFDTGSSTAAICNEDSTLVNSQHDVVHTSLGTVSCNHYVSGQGYSGLFFDTKATATNGVSLSSHKMLSHENTTLI